MIRKIWLVQPLAFARVGSSKEPLQNYYWTSNDLRPNGTGRTDIVADESLSINGAGEVSADSSSRTIRFKEDGQHIRPVCPFFELRGEWDSGEGPITPEILQAAGLRVEDVTWEVEHCNLKASHFTGTRGDRIEAKLQIPLADGNFGIRALEGTSPLDGGEPLIPEGRSISLGGVQITRPTAEFPEFRLRFYAPAGQVYAPTDLKERLAQILEGPQNGLPGTEHLGIPALLEFFDNSGWKDFDLPAEQKILNPKAAWPQHGLVGLMDFLRRLPLLLPRLKEVSDRTTFGERSELLRLVAGPTADVGSLPPGLFAYAVSIGNTGIPPNARAFVSSLGMIDDTGDGIISCTLKGVGTARARIVVCPPNFAADRRQPVSIADGLADRQARSDVTSSFLEADSYAITEEICDLLGRAFETSGLSNLDVWNVFFREENAVRANSAGSQVSPREAEAKLWDPDGVPSVHTLPLTERGRQEHRRIAIRWILEARLLGRPDLIARFIRSPATRGRLYDRRMPAFMRGADREPLHLTRRQFEILKGWASRLG